MDDYAAQLISGVITSLGCSSELLQSVLVTDYVPYEDIVASLPINESPDQKYMVKRKWTRWPVMEPARRTGITVHHTCSHSPLGTARYCSRPVRAGGKGYPSIQYHFWVSAADNCPIFLCAPVEWGIWHDNTGAFQETVAVGMAGRLDLSRPPDEQIGAAVRLIVWLMQEYDIPLENVKGHRDRWFGRRGQRKTICPGWDHTGWRGDFFALLSGEVAG